MPAIRAAVREIDPTLPVIDLHTQDEQIERLTSQERLFARLPGHVLRMIVGDALALVGLGLVLGVTAAFGAGRFIASLLFNLSPVDPLTYASAAVVLTTAALLASLLPARRAAHVDPMNALRAE